MLVDANLDGYAILNSFFKVSDLADVRRDFFQSGCADGSGSSDIGGFAERNILYTHPTVRALASSPQCLSLAQEILGPAARAVKATLFDKTPEGNWKVPPHQDVTITVQERIETPGYSPWTLKAGVYNVQPPVEVLERMVAFRIHLDDCGPDNGALKIWPGSHFHGRLRDDGISDWIGSHSSVVCPVSSGGLMVMRPLLIHASSKATVPTHRRVIQIEYAADDLPGGLRWLG